MHNVSRMKRMYNAKKHTQDFFQYVNDVYKNVLTMWKLTWDSLVAPQITDETLGLAAHHAIESWANGTPSSSAIGFKPSTFRSTSSTSDRDARFYNTNEGYVSPYV
jgi:hypothetical protein